MYLAGPLQGRAALASWRSPRHWPGPTTTARRSSRVAINVDPLDAHVTALSDTVPSIIGGVPIRMRSIRVNIDRPNFMINPTNCSPFTVDSKGIGDQGTVTDFASYFHVDNCSPLPFKPKMSRQGRWVARSRRAGQEPAPAVRPSDSRRERQHQVALGDPVERVRDRPAPPRQHLLGEGAGRKAVRRAAPRSGWRAPIPRCSISRLPDPCTRSRDPGGLPRLAFILNGQVNLVPRADTETVKGGRLKTTVPVVPDAPIGHFQLTVFGGKTGYLINTRDTLQARAGGADRATRPRTARRCTQKTRVKTAVRQEQDAAAPQASFSLERRLPSRFRSGAARFRIAACPGRGVHECVEHAFNSCYKSAIKRVVNRYARPGGYG